MAGKEVATGELVEYEHDPRFMKTEFVVEANSYERHSLWKEYYFDKEADRVSWEQDNSGFWMKLGELSGMPVCYEFFWSTVDGLLVLFYAPTSVVDDRRMVDAFLEKYCNPKWDKGIRRANTNAMNFHHVLNAASDKKKLRNQITGPKKVGLLDAGQG